MTSPDASASLFDLWASVYDEQQNPLLQLEERYLRCILPAIKFLDVLDVGCGTGRWLQALAQQSPRSLTGVDSSPEMLRRAESKVGGSVALHLGDCTALPIAPHSQDLLFASFVLSYVTDIDAFAFECARVCRDGADLFVTDMHPATQRSQNWKRSFLHGRVSFNIESQSHSLHDIICAFRSTGFEIISLLEPTFGSPELITLRRNGKHEGIARHLPPIYLLQLRKHYKPLHSASPLRLTNARIAHGAHEHSIASIDIHDDHLHSIYANSIVPDSTPATSHAIDLSGYLILPGLINPHDHLEFSLYPNLGRGPYANAAQWAKEIHQTDAALIALHRSVPRDVRLWWGAIHNLLCGITTVCHHNPFTAEFLDSEFPVRVVRNFGWGHSLALEPRLIDNFYATAPDHPFILHAAEGTDGNSANEVQTLDDFQILDNRTILVHGLALTPETVTLLNQRGTSVVLCPSSNQFLFHKAPSPDIASALHNVLLGSDSPLTAVGDLLDEIRFAQQSLRLPPEEIYSMTTTRAARILRLPSGEGRLAPGAIADLIAIEDKSLDPAEALSRISFTDIKLVVLGGRIQLATRDVLQHIPPRLRQGLHPIEVDGHLRWIRAPLQWLFTEASNILGPDLRLGGKLVRHVSHH